MALIEIFTDEDDTQPQLEADFLFLPRMGEYLAIEIDGEVLQLDVVEVWHRQEEGGSFRACIRVETSE